MLTLIAAAQNDCPHMLDAHLSWLAQRPLHRTLEQSVRDFAAVLSTHRLRLPAPIPH